MPVNRLLPNEHYRGKRGGKLSLRLLLTIPAVLTAFASGPDLTVRTIHRESFIQGRSGALEISVSNSGNVPISGTVTVTESLPTDFAATGIAGTGWTCTLAVLSCTRADSLAASASYAAINITVAVPVGAGESVTNSVTVSAGGKINTARHLIHTFTASEAAVWSALSPPASLTASAAALLMTDGTVMVQQDCSGNWYRLTPDAFGSYIKGTWSQRTSMPAGYGPSAFSSAVLADGRVVVIGGEYNEPCPIPVFTNLGAVYDPVADTWAPLSPPTSWNAIGDAPNTVLPDGQFLLTDIFFNRYAKLDPVTLTWTRLNAVASSGEAGWTLLPDGTVLMASVDAAPQSERYFPQTDTWEEAGDTVVPLVAGFEIGAQVLRPDGTVFVSGATGHTAIYSVAGGAWSAGPDFPAADAGDLAAGDGPASLLPSGNVLLGLGAYSPSTDFFEFDGSHLNPVPTPPAQKCDVLLLLPTGQVLCTSGTEHAEGGVVLPANIDIYTPSGSPDPAWAPTIATAPDAVQPGATYTITGTQFNGLSQAVAYGDDFQAATNYPLVRIVNTATGHVFYCRTHNHSTMAVATGAAPVSTQFDVPPSIEAGPSTVAVVANGIASSSWSLTVGASTLPPALSIATTADEATVNLGSSIGFTVQVSNSNAAGTGPATGAILNDPLPPDGGVAWSITPNYNGPGACSIAGAVGSQRLGCAFGDMAAGAAASVHVASNPISSCATYRNTANLSATNSIAVQGSATATVSCPGLTVAKKHSGNFTQGQVNVTYTVTVSNSGAGPTRGTVTVAENVPSGLNLVSMAGSNWTCPAGGNTCTRGDALNAGAAYPPVTVTVNVGIGVASPQVNTVTVSGGGSVPASSSDSTTITPPGRCDVTGDGAANTADIQRVLNEALGIAPAVDDINAGGTVDAVDVQLVIGASLEQGCSAQ